MIRGAPGLDVSAVVRGVLAERNVGPSGLSRRLTDEFRRSGGRDRGAITPFDRLFATSVGSSAASMIGNESRTLDAISSLSLEVVFEYLQASSDAAWTSHAKRNGVRVLAVPGMPAEPPSLLILDPDVADVSDSRRITDLFAFDPQGLAAAFQRLRPQMKGVIDDRLVAAMDSRSVDAAIQLLWVSHPEVVVTHYPRMVNLCAPVPHVAITCGAVVSSVGVYCRDATGRIGATGCFHGTGPVGTSVSVGDVESTVALASDLQDTVFIPLPSVHALPDLKGRGRLRSNRAPSEAEPVWFQGAGSQKKVSTWVKSHDAGILRKSKLLQLKVQTPADANFGDSGCSLIDADDHVLGFALDRTGLNEYPEMTDWIWADNAMGALDLVPV